MDQWEALERKILKLALEQKDMRRYYNTRTATKQVKTVDW